MHAGSRERLCRLFIHGRINVVSLKALSLWLRSRHGLCHKSGRALGLLPAGLTDLTSQSFLSKSRLQTVHNCEQALQLSWAPYLVRACRRCLYSSLLGTFTQPCLKTVSNLHALVATRCSSSSTDGDSSIQNVPHSKKRKHHTPAAVLTIKIANAKLLVELVNLYAQHQERFDHLHLVAATHKVAVLVDKQRAHVVKSTKTLLDSLAHRLTKLTHQLSMREVASCVWAWGRLRYIPEPRLISALLVQLKSDDCALIMSASPADLSNLSWGLARLGYRDTAVLERVSDMMMQQAPLFKLEEVAAVVWSWALLSHAPHGLLEALAAVLVQRRCELTSRAIASLALSYKLLGARGPAVERLYAALAEQGCASLKFCKADDLLDITRAYVGRRPHAGQLFDALAMAALRLTNLYKDMRPAQLVDLLTHLAAAGHLHAPLCDFLSSWDEQQLSQLSVSDLARLAAGLAQLGALKRTTMAAVEVATSRAVQGSSGSGPVRLSCCVSLLWAAALCEEPCEALASIMVPRAAARPLTAFSEQELVQLGAAVVAMNEAGRGALLSSLVQGGQASPLIQAALAAWQQSQRASLHPTHPPGAPPPDWMALLAPLQPAAAHSPGRTRDSLFWCELEVRARWGSRYGIIFEDGSGQTCSAPTQPLGVRQFVERRMTRRGLTPVTLDLRRWQACTDDVQRSALLVAVLEPVMRQSSQH